MSDHWDKAVNNKTVRNDTVRRYDFSLIIAQSYKALWFIEFNIYNYVLELVWITSQYYLFGIDIWSTSQYSHENISDSIAFYDDILDDLAHVSFDQQNTERNNNILNCNFESRR